MEEFLNKVAKAPTSAKVGVGVLGVVALFVIHYLVFYSEQQSRLERVRGDLAQTEEKLVQKEAIAKNLTKFQREVERLEQEVNEARTSLPTKRDISELLRRISDLGEKAGLEIKSFTPGEETREKFYARVPIAMELTGTYHEVLSFFYSISRLSRIVNIADVSMSDPAIEEKKVTISTTCNATTYRLLTAEELAEDDDDDKKKKKKKG